MVPVSPLPNADIHDPRHIHRVPLPIVTDFRRVGHRSEEVRAIPRTLGLEDPRICDTPGEQAALSARCSAVFSDSTSSSNAHRADSASTPPAPARTDSSYGNNSVYDSDSSYGSSAAAQERPVTSPTTGGLVTPGFNSLGLVLRFLGELRFRLVLRQQLVRVRQLRSRVVGHRLEQQRGRLRLHLDRKRPRPR